MSLFGVDLLLWLCSYVWLLPYISSGCGGGDARVYNHVGCKNVAENLWHVALKKYRVSL